MRLFHAQIFNGEENSLPPPPHYSMEREATKVMPIYLSQYRDGRRLPTPEKVAVMELSNSFERRRLGKHQQILNDISQRCREQEVSELSNQLSSRANIQQPDSSRSTKDVAFFSTNNMNTKHRSGSLVPESTENTSRILPVDSNATRPVFEKTYKHFPVRRIMRQQTKFDFLKQTINLPQIHSHIPKSSVSDSHMMRASLAHRQQINGPIQLDHYTSPRPDLAPLVLPNFDNELRGVQTERLDRTDTYFSTSRVVLGPRAKTNLIFEGTKSANVTISKPINPMGNYGDVPNLQLMGGHPPPPNSIEVEAPMAVTL